eukprot:NODE_1529_length_1119_cov_174.094925.p1 GENE.NODE_1529_length_1119_cov_174.094925~~NODE_1529_length_1119_cov_174.094925.p1  ORF type:complete len:327 (-),score=64.10 NODE_1529_length_1119_cov_174.094925:123-1028(-)
MLDLTQHGATSGCLDDNCRSTDKFACLTLDRCATVCDEVPGCRRWSWGDEQSVKKCWLRVGKSVSVKAFGFSSGEATCFPNGTAIVGSLHNYFDDVGGALRSPYMSLFNTDVYNKEEVARRKEQEGESCDLHGYLDTNKVPGNFHIGTHGAPMSSFVAYDGLRGDGHGRPSNMRHTINHLYFAEINTDTKLNETQPLDGFESPKARTFQYYLTVSPATLRAQNGTEVHGYQFRAGSFVTNELVGPAIFFRFDVDAIRVTYYTQAGTWSRLCVNLCAIVGGCVAVCHMLNQLFFSASSAAVL